MNHIKKTILVLTVFSFIGNNIFAAGAHVRNGTDAIVAFKLFSTSGPFTRIINPGQTEDMDAGGLVGLDGAEWLYCGKIYRMNLPKRIEGIEGWRDWNLLGDGKTVYIGRSGLLAEFGNLSGSVTAEGKCPCITYGQ